MQTLICGSLCLRERRDFGQRFRPGNRERRRALCTEMGCVRSDRNECAALDTYFDITALQFKLGDIFLDKEIDQLFELFLIHAVSLELGLSGLRVPSELG